MIGNGEQRRGATWLGDLPVPLLLYRGSLTVEFLRPDFRSAVLQTQPYETDVMRPNRPSQTASAAAFLRAAQQGLPEAERILQDPFASQMLTSGVARRMASRRWVGRLIDGWQPGAIDVIAIRDRFSDDHARLVLQNGGQLAMLGAGLDTMPWRLRDLLDRVTVFEVDVPSTQQHRLQLIARNQLPPIESPLVRVAMNFETESVVTRLRDAGLKSDLPTLINWMGVSYYLDETAIAALLRDVRTLTNPQSVLVFDFIQPPREVKQVSGWFRRVGEPLKYFLRPEEFPEFAARHHFEVVELISFDHLAARYSTRNRVTQAPMFAAAIRPLAGGTT